ncbi:MAG TPA: aspartate aminotransferase family protein, partial [Microscillaceae bacterium]|nr:aspartate aminotransferase family protein [Microscillaceae bacterium]
MNLEDFRQHAHQLVDWMADYLQNIEQLPVKSQVAPRTIYQALPAAAPEQGEDFSRIWVDLQQIIMPGITHWQHPGFFAYFPANSSPPSVLAEMLTATLGAQCMLWETSPAAAELEEKVMDWLKNALQLPESWSGVIQDTASTGTLCALLTARERFAAYQINHQGLQNAPQFCVYTSTQAHSSIDKAVKIAGLGTERLRKIAVDEAFALQPQALRQAIEVDLQAGLQPLCVVATVGTTSTTAIDPLPEIGAICQEFGLFLHVDAAYAGTVALLPEKRHLFAGIEQADSFLFNPHKWMLTNFDCTAYFVKDKSALIQTFEILPEYLKTAHDSQVNNYRDWGIQLGRRFRSLKLWFVLRSYGLEGIRQYLRQHLELASVFADKIQQAADFELMAPVSLNLVCFRWKPAFIASSTEAVNRANEQLLKALNNTGKVYLTHTKLGDA